MESRFFAGKYFLKSFRFIVLRCSCRPCISGFEVYQVIVVGIFLQISLKATVGLSVGVNTVLVALMGLILFLLILHCLARCLRLALKGPPMLAFVKLFLMLSSNLGKAVDACVLVQHLDAALVFSSEAPFRKEIPLLLASSVVLRYP